MTKDLEILGYRLEDKLDEGGMSEVWRATHETLGRVVAVKLMKPELRGDPLSVERFKQEARLLSRLRHPNLIAAENLALEPLAIIMEYMEGGPLGARIGGGLPLTRAWSIFKQLLDGAEELHQRGIIHRDLKPDNLLFAKPLGDWLKIVDFGIALEAQRGGLGTAHGKAVGTPEYMPPEQHRGERVDARADVYALGVILYELLSGARPFGEGPDHEGRPRGLAWHHCNTPPPPRPQIPSAIFELICVALDKDQAARFPTAGAFKRALLDLPDLERPSTQIELEAYRPKAREGEGEGRAAGIAPWWRRGRRAATSQTSEASEDARSWAYERAQLKGQISALEADLNEEKSRCVALRAEAGRAERSELRVRQQIEEATRAREASEADREASEAARREAEARCQALEAARAEIDARLRREIAQVAALEAQIATLKARLAGATGVTAGLELNKNQGIDNPAGLDWVFIPGGRFLMGTDSGAANERPVHEVEVASFMMSRAPVTVAQYRRAVEAGACRPPQSGSYYNWGQVGREDHPVNGVSWEDARKFAAWAGGRLASEAEWEYAASGGARRYPWGEASPTCARAVFNSEAGPGCGEGSTWPVGAKPEGNTPEGLVDMAGNVWEWCADAYKGSYADAPADGRPREGAGRRVCRGNGWRSGPADLRATVREGHDPKERAIVLGLRVARDVT